MYDQKEPPPDTGVDADPGNVPEGPKVPVGIGEVCPLNPTGKLVPLEGLVVCCVICLVPLDCPEPVRLTRLGTESGDDGGAVKG